MFEELSWFHFQQLERIKKLPLHEQVLEFDKYIGELSLSRLLWNEYQTGYDNVIFNESGFGLSDEANATLYTDN
jgi:hypothetical protein